MADTAAVEFAGFALAVWLYHRGSIAKSGAGTIAPWGLVVLLSGIYVANLVGPPPPDWRTIAWVGQAQWLLAACGYWIERNRISRTAGGSGR